MKNFKISEKKKQFGRDQDLKDSFDQDIGFIIEDDGYINWSYSFANPIEDYFEIRIERRDLDDKGNYELIVIKLDSFMTSKKIILFR